MQTALKQKRIVDKILTAVVMGYDLDQEFSGHHLFPDVTVAETSGKVLKFGKEAHIIRDTSRAPGETVRGIDFAYDGEDYALVNRLLEGQVPEEFVEEMAKAPGISAQTEAVNIVMSTMRLENEFAKAKLAITAGNYATGHSVALSGTSMWSDGTSDPKSTINAGKKAIRASTGRYPNVLHLDLYGYEALKNHPKITAHFKYSGKQSITTDMLAAYFDIEKVVVAKAVAVPSLESDYTEIWGNHSVLAFVPPQSQRSLRRPSFGYNYIHRGFPKVEKGYYKNDDRSWHYPVLMRDKAVITAPSAGYLIQNTAPIA